jgi:hypothetical protein
MREPKRRQHGALNASPTGRPFVALVQLNHGRSLGGQIHPRFSCLDHAASRVHVRGTLRLEFSTQNPFTCSMAIAFDYPETLSNMVKKQFQLWVYESHAYKSIRSLLTISFRSCKFLTPETVAFDIPLSLFLNAANCA